YQRAIDAYTASLKFEPKNLRVLGKRGWAWDNLKEPNWDAALKDFTEALCLDPTDAESHAGLGYFSACKKDPTAALGHANLAQLYGGRGYMILHNVACVYAKLSEVDRDRRVMYEDLALDQLSRAVDLWQEKRPEPSEIDLMRGEGAFTDSLKMRPEFV